MTNNLEGVRLAESQADKYLTANDMVGRLDAAITEPDIVTVDGSNAVTIDSEELETHAWFHFLPATSGPSGTVTVTVAAVRRGLIGVINECGQSLTVAISGQAEAAPSIPDGASAVLSIDGSDVRSVGIGAASSGSDPTPSMQVSASTLTLGLTHAGKFVEFTNASGCTVTILDNGAVAFPVDTEITLRQGSGAGAVSWIAGDTDVTVEANDGFADSTGGVGAVVQLKYMGSDRWISYGRQQATS